MKPALLILLSLVAAPLGAQVPTTQCNPPGVLVQPSGQVYTCLAAPGTWTLVQVVKTVTAIPNNVLTDVLTVSVPNAASAALIEINLSGSLGAGGAVGQYEATAGRTLLVNVTRVAGLDADISTTVTANATDVHVAGATTISLQTQVSALTGGPTATQTFTVQVKIARGAGGSTNHIVALLSRIISPTLTNITVQH